MRTLLHIMLAALIGSCTSIESELMQDPRYAGGLDLLTRHHIQPRFYKFGRHLFVTGADSSNQATLGYFFNGREVLTQNLAEGVFDTIFSLNLNGDQLPDFLIHCCFNEDCALNALVSGPDGQLRSVTNVEDLGSGQDLRPLMIAEKSGLQVRDLNGDGLDDIVLHISRQEENSSSGSSTHTILAQQILADLNGSD